MINFDFDPSYQVSKKKEYSKFIIPAALYYSKYIEAKNRGTNK